MQAWTGHQKMDESPFVTSKATRCRRCGIVIGRGERCDLCSGRPGSHTDAPGEYEARHHSEWISTVHVLIQEGDDEAAETLLRRLAAAAVAESEQTGQPTTTWYNEQLNNLEKRAKNSLRNRPRRSHTAA
jgi:hypothetical protein